MDKKSPDAFRTISEVADWLGVPTHVLRFWESRFSQVKPVKRAGGRRYYRPTDMELLGGIRKLLHEDGMTIRGVQKLLREKGVKHVAALSPLIDSRAETPADGSNVVPFGSGQSEQTDQTKPDANPPASAPKAETTEPIAKPEEVPAAQESAEYDAVAPVAQPADQDVPPVAHELPAAIQTPADVPPTSETPVSEPVTTAAEAPSQPDMPAPADPALSESADAPAAPSTDPLEPIPHDGPTLAETLAAAERSKADAQVDSVKTDLPSVTPTPDAPTPTPESGIEAETSAPAPDSTVSAPQPSLDLFGLANAEAESTPADASQTDEGAAATLAETPLDGAPEVDDIDSVAETAESAAIMPAEAAARPSETEQEPSPEQRVAEHPESISKPEDAIAPLAEKAAEEESPTAQTAVQSPEPASAEIPAEVAPDPIAPPVAPPVSPALPDISHIPADPADDAPLSTGNTTGETPALSVTLRELCKTGTDIHLPVMQALADRLEALSTQLDRTHKG